MTDKAPNSSRHVRHALYKTDLPGDVVDKLEIVTEISRTGRAETVVERPVGPPVRQQNSWDQIIQDALRALPDANRSIIITMGRTFTVEWAGICRPV